MHTRIQGRHSPPPPTPVKSHSYTPKIQTIFTLMLCRATKAIIWSFAGGPMTARFFGIWILSPLINLNGMKYKKTLSESKLSGSPRLLKERERERERAYGARETFSHNFDFYFVQTAERVYVIVM